MNIVGTIGIVKADATDTFIAGSDKLTGGISRLSCASEPVAQAVTQIFHPRRARANPKKGRSKIAALQVAIPDRDVFYVADPSAPLKFVRRPTRSSLPSRLCFYVADPASSVQRGGARNGPIFARCCAHENVRRAIFAAL